MRRGKNLSRIEILAEIKYWPKIRLTCHEGLASGAAAASIATTATIIEEQMYTYNAKNT